MAHVRALCGPLLEMLYWTCLCEGSGLSIAHVIWHCHVIQHSCVSHGFVVLMCEDLGRVGPCPL